MCDQGATNRSALKLLCKDESIPGPYFTINNHKIFTIFDPPHLLKNTRNALLTYKIKYGKNKTANIEHIRQCFYIDKNKRFRGLRRIREVYI